MGIQFEPIPGFTNGHIGLFWTKLGGSSTWPIATDDSPLTQEFERFGEELEWGPINMIRFGLRQLPEARVRLSNSSQDRMIQIQNGRLIYNWLGKGDPYPHYEAIKPEFDRIVAQFREFLQEQSLPEMSPNQWEVTYINHLPKDTVWKNVTDWSQVLNFHAVPPERVGDCKLHHFGGQWTYEIAPDRGRLHMQLQHGWTADKSELLIFNLTARGPIRNGEDLNVGLNLGHDVIIGAFTQLTSDQAQAHWGKESPQ